MTGQIFVLLRYFWPGYVAAWLLGLFSMPFYKSCKFMKVATKRVGNKEKNSFGFVETPYKGQIFVRT